MAIGQHHLTPLQFRQVQLDCQVLRDAEMHRSAVGQGQHLQRRQIRPGGVAEGEAAADQTHEARLASPAPDAAQASLSTEAPETHS